MTFDLDHPNLQQTYSVLITFKRRYVLPSYQKRNIQTTLLLSLSLTLFLQSKSPTTHTYYT